MMLDFDIFTKSITLATNTPPGRRRVQQGRQFHTILSQSASFCSTCTNILSLFAPTSAQTTRSFGIELVCEVSLLFMGKEGKTKEVKWFSERLAGV
jgi:hypothetical protein